MFLALYFVRLANHSQNELQCGQRMQVEPACVHLGGLGPQSGHRPAETVRGGDRLDCDRQCFEGELCFCSIKSLSGQTIDGQRVKVTVKSITV